VAQAAVRAPVTLRVHLSDHERAFYDEVFRQARIDLARSKRGAPASAIINRERTAASCLAATREAFEEAVQTHHASSLSIERMVFDQDSTDEDPQTEATDRLLALSRRIGSRDAKFDLFEETLRKALAEQAGSKALVFSFFRRTLEYLRRRLRDLGYQVDVIHGGVLIPD
jgi:hypothetical protein